MRKSRSCQIYIAIIIGTAPAIAVASDPGSPSEWLAALYLMIAAPLTVANLIGIVAGGTFGWYKDKDAAIAHASIATMLYVCGMPLAFLALRSWAQTLVAMIVLGVLIFVSIKAPLKLHEIQKPKVHEKLLRDYAP